MKVGELKKYLENKSDDLEILFDHPENDDRIPLKFQEGTYFDQECIFAVMD